MNDWTERLRKMAWGAAGALLVATVAGMFATRDLAKLNEQRLRVVEETRFTPEDALPIWEQIAETQHKIAELPGSSAGLDEALKRSKQRIEKIEREMDILHPRSTPVR